MIEVHIKDPECKKGNYDFITVACGFESEIIVVTNGSNFPDRQQHGKSGYCRWCLPRHR